LVRKTTLHIIIGYSSTIRIIPVGVSSSDISGEDFLLPRSGLKAAIPQKNCTVKRDFSSGEGP
jgi:hypothetical protein